MGNRDPLLDREFGSSTTIVGDCTCCNCVGDCNCCEDDCGTEGEEGGDDGTIDAPLAVCITKGRDAFSLTIVGWYWNKNISVLWHSFVTYTSKHSMHWAIMSKNRVSLDGTSLFHHSCRRDFEIFFRMYLLPLRKKEL